MILPNGDVIWAELRLSFINMKELIFHLKSLDFTGYISCNLPDMQGTILFQEGDVVLGLEVHNGTWVKGRDVAEDILKKIHNETKGTVDIVSYTPPAVSVLSQVFTPASKKVHDNLSSEFSHLGKFLNQMQKEQFNGYIEISPMNKEDAQIQVLLFNKGNLIGVISDVFLGLFDKNDTQHKATLQSYVQSCQNKGVRYNAYAFED